MELKISKQLTVTTLFKIELSSYPAPWLGANMRPEEILQ
jgi:hypothetical protein